MENLNKIFEVVEDNSAHIPEGVYLQLMNLLKAQHKEITDNGNNQNEIKNLKDTQKKLIEIINNQGLEIIQQQNELKNKDFEILFEKKKTNALIRHIGGDVEFNMSFMKYKFQHTKINN